MPSDTTEAFRSRWFWWDDVPMLLFLPSPRADTQPMFIALGMLMLLGSGLAITMTEPAGIAGWLLLAAGSIGVLYSLVAIWARTRWQVELSAEVLRATLPRWSMIGTLPPLQRIAIPLHEIACVVRRDEHARLLFLPHPGRTTIALLLKDGRPIVLGVTADDSGVPVREAAARIARMIDSGIEVRPAVRNTNPLWPSARGWPAW